MYSIGLIIPYFGKKPEFYDAWEVTALSNSTIDFFIFTDIEDIIEKQNIRVIKCSFEECKNMIQKVIDFKICLDTPYKLCDYRPTFGLVFDEYIKDYDFWGYCDLDLIFGDLRKYFTESILENSDRCLENGHISLWRNCTKLNNIFKYQELRGGKNYQEVYTSPDSYYFDEQAGVFTKCLINGVLFSLPVPLRDPIAHKNKFYYGKKTDKNQYIIFWEKGKLYAVYHDKKIELCYAHFFRRKFKVIPYRNLINSIKIVPGEVVFNERINEMDFQVKEKKFYEIKSKITLIKNNLKRYGLYKMICRQIWARKSNKYINEIRKKYQ